MRSCAARKAQLVRLPAALSVPGDVLAGAAASTGTPPPRILGTLASSVALYWAGMALDDYADATVDAVERPDDPYRPGELPAAPRWPPPAGSPPPDSASPP